MIWEPIEKRAVAFIDGQNLFHSAKEAFGYPYPNFDPLLIAQAICKEHGWKLVETRFYTGIPDQADNPFWHQFWTAKLAQMGRQGVKVYSRSLKYRNKVFTLPQGESHSVLIGHEKGIDVRLAIDVLNLAISEFFDVAVIFSQDQDLSEVATEIRNISNFQRRWLKIVSAFPHSPASSFKAGINGTDWIKIHKSVYDSCIDERDYRPRKSTNHKS